MVVIDVNKQRAARAYAQAQLTLQFPKQACTTNKVNTAISERLLLRTEEAINQQLSHIRKLDSLAFARLCRIYRPTGFQHNREFNTSWLPTMQGMPTSGQLREASMVVSAVAKKFPRALDGCSYLSTEEKEAFFARDYQMHIALLCRLGMLFESGKSREFLSELSGLKQAFEKDSALLFERRVYLLLSLDRVLEGAREIVYPHSQ